MYVFKEEEKEILALLPSKDFQPGTLAGISDICSETSSVCIFVPNIQVGVKSHFCSQNQGS